MKDWYLHEKPGIPEPGSYDRTQHACAHWATDRLCFAS